MYLHRICLPSSSNISFLEFVSVFKVSSALVRLCAFSKNLIRLARLLNCFCCSFRHLVEAMSIPLITHLWASQFIRGEVSASLFSSKYYFMPRSTSTAIDGFVSKQGSSFHDREREYVSGNAMWIEIEWWSERNIGSMHARWRMGRSFCEMNR